MRIKKLVGASLVVIGLSSLTGVATAAAATSSKTGAEGPWAVCVLQHQIKA